ncbi:MAG: hypothetical protein AAF988_08990, partial [Pseudomonadota bacterium]
MIFILMAYVAHVLENTLIAYIVQHIGPFVCILLFYLISTMCLCVYEKIVTIRKLKQPMNWPLVFKHKGPLIAYIFGSFFGNALWFMSVFLIGIG